MKYIDAEKLKEELEMRKTVYIGHALSLRGTNLIDGFDEALSFIDSLPEQPEIDLDKEVVEWTEKYFSDKDAVKYYDFVRLVMKTAKHFFELGQKANKYDTKDSQSNA